MRYLALYYIEKFKLKNMLGKIKSAIKLPSLQLEILLCFGLQDMEQLVHQLSEFEKMHKIGYHRYTGP